MAGRQAFKFKVDGLKELQNAIERMEEKTQVSVVRSAVRKSAEPTQKAIAINIAANLTTMNAQARAVYSRMIKMRTGRDKRGNVNARIYTKNEKLKLASGRTVNFRPLVHLFEWGVKPHKIVQPKMKRVLDHPGIPENKIWGPIFDREAPNMGESLKKNLVDRIAKEWNKK